MQRFKTAWLTVVAGLLTLDCAAFPYASHIEESREYFLARKAELTALVMAAKEDGYVDVSCLVMEDRPWSVYFRNEHSAGKLSGANRERYENFFKRAEVGKVWKTGDCYNVGVAHPDTEFDFTATFEAPCEVSYEEPDCLSFAKTPPRGSCNVRLQDGWNLVYFWTPPIDRSRTE